MANQFQGLQGLNAQGLGSQQALQSIPGGPGPNPQPGAIPIPGAAASQMPAQQPAPAPGTPGGQQPGAPKPWAAVFSIIFQDELSKAEAENAER